MVELGRAKERRRIEAALFSGKLCGVAATNVLDLGIDVGCLDATLHLGFPGSIAVAATNALQVYEGAVYMNQGITYLVKSLDLHGRIALLQKADLKYYTKTRDYTDIHVIGGDLAYPPTNTSETKYSRTTAHITKCEVSTFWFGFYRIWCRSNQIFDRVDLSLPKYSYESKAVWIRIPQTIKVTVEIQELSFRAGQHAASHALLNAVPLFLMCNSSDLGAECANPYDNRDIPERRLMYDQCPGGMGISTQLHRIFDELLAASLSLVTACHCSSNTGCPSCIQTLTCQEFNEVLDKKAALMILQGVKDSEDELFGDR